MKNFKLLIIFGIAAILTQGCGELRSQGTEVGNPFSEDSPSTGKLNESVEVGIGSYSDRKSEVKILIEMCVTSVTFVRQGGRQTTYDVNEYVTLDDGATFADGLFLWPGYYTEMILNIAANCESNGLGYPALRFHHNALHPRAYNGYLDYQTASRVRFMLNQEIGLFFQDLSINTGRIESALEDVLNEEDIEMILELGALF